VPEDLFEFKLDDPAFGRVPRAAAKTEFAGNPCLRDAKLHSKIERGDQEDSDGGVLLVARSRADAGNEAV